jgi:hypothetical protein
MNCYLDPIRTALSTPRKQALRDAEAHCPWQRLRYASQNLE